MKNFINPFESLKKDGINTIQFCDKKFGEVEGETAKAFLIKTAIVIDGIGDDVISFGMPKSLCNFDYNKNVVLNFRFNKDGIFKIEGMELTALEFIKGLKEYGF